jgi:hypothetical protein
VPSSRYISDELQNQVRDRAQALCEYCHAIEQWQYIKFTIDHIIPLQKSGANQIENLALACFHCNRRKSNHMTGTDPDTEEIVRLFNPRTDQWENHFIWSTDKLTIIGRSPIGRATIQTLELNRDRAINIRAADLEINRHPPNGDPILNDIIR